MSGGWSTTLLMLLGIAAVGVMVYSMGFATKQLEVFAFLKPAPMTTGTPTSFGKILSVKAPISATITPAQK